MFNATVPFDERHFTRAANSASRSAASLLCSLRSGSINCIQSRLPVPGCQAVRSELATPSCEKLNGNDWL